MEDGSYVRGSEGWEARKALDSRYGASEAQLGNMTGSGDENTFWGATCMTWLNRLLYSSRAARWPR